MLDYKYEIITKNGCGTFNHYFINGKNEIATENCKDYSGKWLLVGFIDKRKYTLKNEDIIDIDTFYKMDDKDKYYKNGKCKYYVVDNDHNTLRVWCMGNEIFYIKQKN